MVPGAGSEEQAVKSLLQFREGTTGCQPHFWEVITANLPQHGSQAASLLRLGSPLLVTGHPTATLSTKAKHVFVITSVTTDCF